MNRKDLIDLHTHSVASRHAMSTIMENIRSGQQRGLLYYGISDHAPGMPHTTYPSYFDTLPILPRQWEGLHLLLGAELNILNPRGEVDLIPRILDRLDYAIACLHVNCMAPGTEEENTSAYLNAMDNPYVRILGHPDDGRFPYDLEAVIRRAKDRHVLIEVNDTSLHPDIYRPKARKILTQVIRICKDLRQPVIMGSDAHFAGFVGDHAAAIRFLDEQGFPEELVVNYHEELIREFLLQPKESRRSAAR